MGVVKRRYAMLGWAVWKLAKRVAKRKARDVVPTPALPGRGSAALAAGVAAFVGVLTFLRRRRSRAD